MYFVCRDPSNPSVQYCCDVWRSVFNWGPMIALQLSERLASLDDSFVVVSPVWRNVCKLQSTLYECFFYFLFDRRLTMTNRFMVEPFVRCTGVGPQCFWWRDPGSESISSQLRIKVLGMLLNQQHVFLGSKTKRQLLIDFQGGGARTIFHLYFFRDRSMCSYRKINTWILYPEIFKHCCRGVHRVSEETPFCWEIPASRTVVRLIIVPCIFIYIYILCKWGDLITCMEMPI